VSKNKQHAKRKEKGFCGKIVNIWRK